MKKISVAFGPHGHTTLAWAVELARLTRVPLEVVNVFEPTYAEVSPQWFDELVATRREELDRVVADVTDVAIDVIVLAGHEPLREFARHLDESADCLGVIGARGTHAPGGLGFGHTGHALLHHSSQPVAVVHPDHEWLAGGVIVVGVDGSAANAAALAWARAVGAAVGGTIHAVFVEEPSMSMPASEVEAVVAARSGGSDGAAPLEFHRLTGHPTAALVEYAERVHAAMVVVGTRGHGGFDGLVLGRVPAQLLAHCTAPLVVVPH